MKHTLLLVIFLGLAFGNCQAQTEFDKPYISIGIIVSDLDASLKFYNEIIGMKEVGGFGIDESFGKSSGLTGGTPFDVKILKLVDSPNATEFKFMTFGIKKNPSDQFIQQKNGIRYITLQLPSIKEVQKRLEENHIKTLGDTPIKLSDGRTFILIQDPDGVFIELIGN